MYLFIHRHLVQRSWHIKSFCKIHLNIYIYIVWPEPCAVCYQPVSTLSVLWVITTRNNWILLESFVVSHPFFLHCCGLPASAKKTRYGRAFKPLLESERIRQRNYTALTGSLLSHLYQRCNASDVQRQIQINPQKRNNSVLVLIKKSFSSV